MFIKSILLIIIGTLTLFAGIKSFSHARGGHFNESRMEKRAQYMIKRATSELSLNAAQQAMLQEVKTELLTKGKNLRNSRFEIGDALLAEATSDEFNGEALDSLFTQKESDFQLLRKTLLAKMGDFHASLNSEQREKLTQKLQKLNKRRNHRRK
ncbi:MAG: Spy/CpxP family protein refolding chaperone [Calditrichia bacterium]